MEPCESSKKRSAPPSEEGAVRKRLKSSPTDAAKGPSERDELPASRSSNDLLGLSEVPRVVDGQCIVSRLCPQSVVLVPTFRHKHLDPLRATMRLNEEACDDAAFCKRHDKLERNERQLVR